MCLPLRDPCISTVALKNVGEQLLTHRTKGPKSGEAKRDEVEAMGPTSGGMLVSLTLLNRWESSDSVTPTTAGRRHSHLLHLTVRVTTPRVDEDARKSGQTGATAGLQGHITLKAEVSWLHNMRDPRLANDDAQGLLHHAVAKLDVGRGGVTTTQQGMVTMHIHRGTITQACEIWWEQVHAQPVASEIAEMASVEGLLQA